MFAEIYRVTRTETLAELDNQRRKGTKSEADLRSEMGPLLEAGGLPETHQRLVMGGALLWHDHLASAHQIAQEIESAEGSLLHGIMHRREPDYGNAAYWFRRVGPHPLYQRMARECEPVLRSGDPALCSRLIVEGAWDPFAFIRACESAVRGPASSGSKVLLEEAQRIELECFLRHLCGE